LVKSRALNHHQFEALWFFDGGNEIRSSQLALLAQASEFRELSTPEVLSKISALKKEIASVRFLQRTRGISEVKPGEQQNPDPEKVHTRRGVYRGCTMPCPANAKQLAKSCC